MTCRRRLIALCLLTLVIGIAPAGAQIVDPIAPPVLAPPPPPPPPPPPIVVPQVPVLGETARPSSKPPRRENFSQRVRRCQQEAAAAGLGPNEISAYSRACADR